MPIVAALGVFLVAWQLAVVLGGLQPSILPPPLLVAERFVEAFAEGTIQPHLATTLQEIALGFAAGAVLGLAAGYVMARSPFAERLLSPYIVAAQAVPILALAPLLAIWFGPGLLSKVVICGLIVFFPVAVSTMVGIRTVDPRLIELGRSLRATRRQLLWTIEVPSALPSILGGLRVGVTLSVIGAIVGEWAGASRGLGVLINLARGSLFDIPLMFATLLTIALVGIGLYRRRRPRRAPPRRRPLISDSEVPVRARFVVGLLAVLLVVAGCGVESATPIAAGSESPAATEPAESEAATSPSPQGSVVPVDLSVGLGYIPSVQFAPFYLAAQEGYYGEAGLNVEFQNRIDPDLDHARRTGHHRRRHR